ncbi:MAG: molybdenum cofactor guanylyltransferase [Dissulfurispiraceae bacterium]
MGTAKKNNSGVDTGVILAGGKNRRFPLIKSFIKVEGVAIISRNLSILQEVFTEVFISTNTPEVYFHLGVPLLGDALPASGPMTGIYTALFNSKGEDVFAVACDMPFISGELILFLCGKHREILDSKPVGATVPVFNGQPQPLFGVYAKTVLPQLEKGILSGKTSMRRFLDEIETNLVDETEVRMHDPEGRSFINLNTVEDYEEVMRRR